MGFIRSTFLTAGVLAMGLFVAAAAALTAVVGVFVSILGVGFFALRVIWFVVTDYDAYRKSQKNKDP